MFFLDIFVGFAEICPDITRNKNILVDLVDNNLIVFVIRKNIY
jgi:hypothetical protein